MKFPHFNRRLHLYLSLGLLPWVLMYGISSYFYAHPDVGKGWYGGKMQWSPVGATATLPADVTIPQAGAEQEVMRAFGRRVLDLAGLSSEIGSVSYGAYRTGPKQISVFAFRFLKQMQMRVNTEERTFVTEQKHFRWDQFFTGMHARAGFEQEGFWPFVWALVVDLASIGFLLWVATGLYMWWTLGARQARAWGWLPLLAGVLSFAFFLMKL
ncbi:MAG: hypothetical protein ABI972_09500 [Acidobacteriota bacterium]